MYNFPVFLWIDLLLFCIIHNCRFILTFPPCSYIFVWVFVTVLRPTGIRAKKAYKLMFNKTALAFKAYKTLAPPYLKQLLICSNSRFITLPKPRTDLFKSSFSFSCASLWDTIPTQIKLRNSLTSFKTLLHKWSRSRLL